MQCRGAAKSLSGQANRWVSIDQATPELGAGHYVVFCVCDTGRGMTPETLARAAEPFFTTKAAGHGTGLGLSMAYGFVKQSGGNVKIESRLGYGTRVELYLPVAPSSSAHAAACPAQPFRPATAKQCWWWRTIPRSAAIADGFASLAGLSRRFRRETPRRLCRRCEANPAIALLFSDVMLGPGMSGTELAQAARRPTPGSRRCC